MAVFRIDSSSIGNLQTDSIIATGSLQGTASFAATSLISLRPINTTGSTLYSTVPSTGNVSPTNGLFLGSSAGAGATSANFSVFLGYLAGQSATNANESIFIGPLAGGEAAKAPGAIALGSGAGYRAVSASYSTLIGYYVGSNTNASTTIGTGNIIIGNNITLPPGTQNSINLGAIIFATGSYSTLGAGNLYSGSQAGIGRVGINKVTPIYTLDVSGSGNYTNGLTVTGSLDVRAQGTSSTDIAFRVRNSANTVNLVRFNGDGTHFFFNSNGTTNINFYEYGHGIWANGGSSFRIKNLNGSTSIEGTTSTRFITDVTNKAITFDGRQLHIGGQTLPTINGDSCIIIESGTAPTTALADRIYLYSADRNGVAGKASPHFRTEDGTTLWLGDESRLFNVTASNISASSLTTTQIGIGAAPSGSTRLDVRAQGALSTDVAFRVRNSADTKNIVEVRGDSEIRFNGVPAVGNYVAIKNYTAYDATIDLMTGDGVKAQIFNDNASNTNLHRGLNIWNPGIVGQATAKINNIIKSGLSAYGQAYGFNWAITANSSGTYTQAERAMFLTHQNSLVLYSGSSSPTDAFGEKSGSFEIFASSSTSTAGVVPHFKTERGTILWLGSQSRLFNVTASNLIISSSATIGFTSSVSTENTLTLGPPPAGGTGEGGQLGLAAAGGSYTSSSMLDTWQNQFRILRGTNASSNVGLMYMDLQTGNTNFVGAVTASGGYSNLPNDYLYATRATSNQTIGSGTWADRDIIFNNTVVSKGITYDTGTGLASLTGGKVYRITARLAWSAAATYLLQFSCYTSANTQIGPTVEIIQSTNGTNNISDGTLDFIYAPGSNTDIKIRTTTNTTALTGESIRYDLNTQFIIQQIA